MKPLRSTNQLLTDRTNSQLSRGQRSQYAPKSLQSRKQPIHSVPDKKSQETTSLRITPSQLVDLLLDFGDAIKEADELQKQLKIEDKFDPCSSQQASASIRDTVLNLFSLSGSTLVPKPPENCYNGHLDPQNASGGHLHTHPTVKPNAGQTHAVTVTVTKALGMKLESFQPAVYETLIQLSIALEMYVALLQRLDAIKLPTHYVLPHSSRRGLDLLHANSNDISGIVRGLLEDALDWLALFDTLLSPKTAAARRTSGTDVEVAMNGSSNGIANELPMRDRAGQTMIKPRHMKLGPGLGSPEQQPTRKYVVISVIVEYTL
ncbi:hypothetical protein MPH_06887 [Macrophomina phaseolina MS6]|uniref:Uncharacterized protein n=1 Tax=Macrophomina phaseolina (strain MS6) TaxID=1126212 RepID=K2R132_MACPH|nr:hypothetical protein MPH_06887 [Macrophomina phaseolina MS6]